LPLLGKTPKAGQVDEDYGGGKSGRLGNAVPGEAYHMNDLKYPSKKTLWESRKLSVRNLIGVKITRSRRGARASQNRGSEKEERASAQGQAGVGKTYGAGRERTPKEYRQ